MRITQETDYAFRIVSFLASHENEVVGAPRIAEAESVTERFTLRILRKLNLAGITDAKRGARGGYYLKKKKEDITLYEIILAIDGPIIINRCLEKDGFCSKRSAKDINKCKFHSKLNYMQRSIVEMFKNETIDKYI